MSVKELLAGLNINKVGTYSDTDSYVIDLDGSNEWGNINSKLDKSDLLEYQDEVSFLNVDNSNQVYNYLDEYQITLMADFNEDSYQLVIAEI